MFLFTTGLSARPLLRGSWVQWGEMGVIYSETVRVCPTPTAYVFYAKVLSIPTEFSKSMRGPGQLSMPDLRTLTLIGLWCQTGSEHLLLSQSCRRQLPAVDEQPRITNPGVQTRLFRKIRNLIAAFGNPNQGLEMPLLYPVENQHTDLQ
ncbi:uncharacterized protein isoform X1 [Salmo salar]|uniref:Uncharacterized protein isoform X1 n=1 Tax=Salmo salar TaxID=8030 RepID=A0ABM3CNX8_SALSA|nr:uncharacterized protein LOC106567801 isoform X1 [Salmo salar]